MKSLLIILGLVLPFSSFAQETVVRKHHLTEAVTEHISVLKTDHGIRQGMYKATLPNGNTLALGVYTNNLKTGVWSFYDDENNLLQRYNYTEKKLIFEAREDTTSNCRYLVDQKLRETDRVTKPVRIGDRYYGYINYLKLFRLPEDMRGANGRIFTPTVELLVSPGGRLADFVVHLNSVIYQSQDVRLNINLLSEEDRTFIPATLNGEPVLCRIIIRCVLTDDGQLDID